MSIILDNQSGGSTDYRDRIADVGMKLVSAAHSRDVSGHFVSAEDISLVLELLTAAKSELDVAKVLGPQLGDTLHREPDRPVRDPYDLCGPAGTMS